MKAIFASLLFWSCVFAGPPLGVSPAALSQSAALQAVIDQGGPLVYVPAGVHEVTESIRLRSGIVLFCEQGAVLQAAPGAFKDPYDSLLIIDEATNVRVENCEIVMLKASYTVANGYAVGEWRHGIRILGSTSVTIQDVTVQAAGGDGIYIGPKVVGGIRKPSRNVTILRCTIEDSHRNGISVTSGQAVIDDCLLVGSKGTAPQAGLDIEPSAGADLIDVTVRRVTSQDNAGGPFVVALGALTADSPPPKVAFTDCDGRRPGNQLRWTRAFDQWGNFLATIPVGAEIRWNDLAWRK